ncbi:MAG: small-conductance mechanosensitive channel [Oceanicoccus sp.]|jgi:small-conductance mechanosensitive channel
MKYLDFFQETLGLKILSIGEYSLHIGMLLAAVVTMFAAYWISRIIRKNLGRVAERSQHNQAQIYTINRVIHYVILVVAFLIGSSFLGLSFDKLAIVVGALGVGIGFGLQNIVNNFVSGIIILFDRSIKMGDFIELESGTFGEVKEINIRSTMIRTSDNVDILVPNSEFINGRVTNWTLEEDVRRFRVPFSVAYGTDKELVKRCVLDAAAKVDHTLSGKKRDPQVLMKGFGDSSLDFDLIVWVKAESVKRPALLISDYLWMLDDTFREFGIEVPFPQRDVHIKNQKL